MWLTQDDLDRWLRLDVEGYLRGKVCRAHSRSRNPILSRAGGSTDPELPLSILIEECLPAEWRVPAASLSRRRG